jgi:hypothetical protein
MPEENSDLGSDEKSYKRRMAYAVCILSVLFVFLLVILPYSPSSRIVDNAGITSSDLDTAPGLEDVPSGGEILESDDAGTESPYDMKGQNVTLSIELNGDVFYSEDLMIINVTVDSVQDYDEELRLRVDGIHAGPFQKLSEYEDFFLDAGTMNIIFEYDVPRCYGCSGIDPGTYNMTAILSLKKEVLASDFIEFEIAE